MVVKIVSLNDILKDVIERDALINNDKSRSYFVLKQNENRPKYTFYYDVLGYTISDLLVIDKDPNYAFVCIKSSEASNEDS